MSADEGFDAFVQAATPSLVRFATSLTGSRHDGWDLVQEGYIRLFAAWPRVERDRDPHAYARMILVRLNLNRIRAARREVATQLRMGAERPNSDVAELDAWLVQAFSTLSPRQRSAVALVHVWDYSIEDAGRLMGCRANTVKTHLARAMAALRAASPEKSKGSVHADGI